MNFRTLVLCDDQWHPAADVQRGFGALADSRFAFEYVADGGQWSPEQLQDFPLVVVAKANHIDATNPAPWLTVWSMLGMTPGSFRCQCR